MDDTSTPASPVLTLRRLEERDLPAALALNAGAVPHVGRIDMPGLVELVGWASMPVAAELEDRLAAFAVVLGPGAPYTSPNYRWFADRYERFLYVDRIVVAPNLRGQGLGAAVYDHVEANAGDAEVLTAEVNLRPRNDGSLAFHAARGFTEVGQQEVYDGAFLVSLVAKPLSP